MIGYNIVTDISEDIRYKHQPIFTYDLPVTKRDLIYPLLNMLSLPGVFHVAKFFLQRVRKLKAGNKPVLTSGRYGKRLVYEKKYFCFTRLNYFCAYEA